MKYVMTLEQFLFLVNEAKKSDAVNDFKPTSSTTGFIETQDAQVGYSYDGSALQYTILRKYTLAAKMALASVFEHHIDDIISDVLSTANVIEAEKNKGKK